MRADQQAGSGQEHRTVSRTIVINVAAELPKMVASAPNKAEIETKAASVVETILSGAHVERKDLGQGKQIRDFDVILPSGVCQHLEVTCATVESIERARAAHERHMPTAVVKAVPGLGYNWGLVASHRVRFGQTNRHTLAEPLRKVEEARLPRWFDTRHARALPDLADLGFLAAFRHAPCSPNMSEVVIGPPTDDSQWASSADDPGAHAIAAIENAAALPDNRAKLAGHDAERRHLFVWVADTHYLPWRDLFCGALPVRDPVLPEEINAVWIGADLPGATEVWTWTADDGWKAYLIGSAEIAQPDARDATGADSGTI
jgi:hypothetical protein